ncbi:MAG: sulfur carrier protein ThiS [Ignavibacteriales bacterium]|jgi:thiamine biosynthesis protein ThiS|nr:sulfur carrier protein ThiS [Ignavibacteriales bacterium]
MKIILNNKEEILNTNLEKLTIAQLLELKKFSFPRLIVRVNDRLIKKEEYDKTYFVDGDKVDVIHMISGG